ncbi:MAG TPA: hypothetical protein VM509_10835, partial [Planctomycetota bacterium]|nr:hypothetical protein [Planctomycetota bacterium]
LPAAARNLACPNPVKDDAPLNFSFTGNPGDRVVLVFSATPQFLVNLPQNGVSLVGSPLLPMLSRVDLGTIPAGGTLNAQLPIPDAVAPTGMAVNRYLQAVLFDAQGTFVRTQAANLVVLDKVF